MVMELILPGLGILAISGAVGAFVYQLSNKRIRKAIDEINDAQDMRDKRIRDAIKETLVNDLDRVKAEGLKVADTVDDSIQKMKKLEVERGEFKKEVADHLRLQLKQELGSRLRDSMARLTQISEDQTRLEELVDATKKDVRGGIMLINNKITSLKDETRKVEDKFVQIKDMFLKISSRKEEIEEDILQSLRKKGLKDIDTRLQELNTQVRLTKDLITRVEEDRDGVMVKMKNLNDETAQGRKLIKDDIMKEMKKIKTESLDESKKLKNELSHLSKENKKLVTEVERLKKKLAPKTKNNPKSKKAKTEKKKAKK
jgi:hypothetical protein